MTEAEAMERCDMLINGFSINNSMHEAFKDNEKGYPTFKTMKEFAETCKEALEKQIAKKVETKWKQSNAFYGKCPSCDCNIVKMPYCPKCGQRFDWE